VGEVSASVLTPVEEEKEVVTEFFEDEIGLDDPDKFACLSGEQENKSLRQKMIEWFLEDPRAKSRSEILKHFPALSTRDLDSILINVTNFCPILIEEGKVVWSLTNDVELSDSLEDEGMLSFLTGREFKKALVSGELEFEDPESADVGKWVEFATCVGYDLISSLTDYGRTKRVFRKGSIPDQLSESQQSTLLELQRISKW